MYFMRLGKFFCVLLMAISFMLTACGGGGGGGNNGGVTNPAPNPSRNIAAAANGATVSSSFGGNESFVIDGDV